jgi:hypothetical protein
MNRVHFSPVMDFLNRTSPHFRVGGGRDPTRVNSRFARCRFRFSLARWAGGLCVDGPQPWSQTGTVASPGARQLGATTGISADSAVPSSHRKLQHSLSSSCVVPAVQRCRYSNRQLPISDMGVHSHMLDSRSPIGAPQMCLLASSSATSWLCLAFHRLSASPSLPRSN